MLHDEELRVFYARVENVQAIELPCGEGSMLVLLPDARDGLGPLERDLASITTRAIATLVPRVIDVKLPRDVTMAPDPARVATTDDDEGDCPAGRISPSVGAGKRVTRFYADHPFAVLMRGGRGREPARVLAVTRVWAPSVWAPRGQNHP
jgi:hypothetical protein